jgi:CheY-like chemotaxis protein
LNGIETIEAVRRLLKSRTVFEEEMTMADKIAVLVVEDEPITRMDVVDQLEEGGFKVYQAPDADRAIKILETNPAIRILFTDIDMPGSMDGLKLAAAVRDRWPPIKIVVASGLRKINMDALPDNSRFFSKPYNVNEIAATMRSMVQMPLG